MLSFFSAISLVITSLGSVLAYDFFLVKKKDSELLKGKYSTDWERVKKLYSEIRRIEEGKILVERAKYSQEFGNGNGGVNRDYVPTFPAVLEIVITSIYKTIESVINIRYKQLLHKIYSPKKINRYLEIPYYIDDRWYKILIPYRIGIPDSIERVEDENGKDVTSLIAPYLGPDEDFHNCRVSPKTFGYKSLHFFFNKIALKDSVKFEENDIINL